MRIDKHISGKRVVPSVPGDFTVSVGDRHEEVAPTSRRNGVSGLGLFIEYVDREGYASRRRIGCRSYDPGHDCLNAWCFEREAPRAFRLDRITMAACTESGEIFDVGELIFILRKRGMPARDPRLGKVLTPLVFLMRCDGVQAGEMEALEEAVTSFAMRFDGDDATFEDGLRLTQTLAPDETDFRRSLIWLKRRGDGPQLAKFLQREGCRLLDADGMHSPEEASYGILLDEALRPIVGRER